MFIGLDLGTSALKALLVDEDERVVGTASVPLTVLRPRPGWSEQDPQDWREAALAALDELASRHPAEIAAVRGIGLSGQMHGAVLLDGAANVLRPCILWNDTRAGAECRELEEAVPELGALAGNLATPGFTAPKLIWVRKHEPAIFARIATVLLPKAWLRLCLTGDLVEEMSDASGTLWLDVGARAWSERLLSATGLPLSAMPRLVEGTAPAGRLRPELAARWGMLAPPVFAGGASDNAAGALGLGAIVPGSAFVSLGTSGVLWATTEAFRPHPEGAVHAFCHALPGLWHQMGVTLSAAASLAWWAGITGRSEADLLAEINPSIDGPSDALFLPYLSGERTPHNDSALRGVFARLSHRTDRAALTQAILEGVAFSIRDCMDALAAAGTIIGQADAIGGGSRSGIWLTILAAVLGIPLHRTSAGEHGAVLGAARVGRLAATGEAPEIVCTAPNRVQTFEPDPVLTERYGYAFQAYRELARSARHIASAPF
jgi:xylulokinase